jgi:hypothetical protein
MGVLTWLGTGKRNGHWTSFQGKAFAQKRTLEKNPAWQAKHAKADTV